MMPFVRSAAPDFLTTHGPRWTRQWQDALALGKPFRWFEHDHLPVNRHLMPHLLAQTDGHCAYCDLLPLGVEADPEIDHHRPKTHPDFARLAFDWANLYGVCRLCNGRKRDQWEPELLAPDELGYRFERYFDFDGMTGWLAPRAGSSADDQRRALCTIAVLDLNHSSRVAHRKRLARMLPAPDEPVAYRYLTR